MMNESVDIAVVEYLSRHYTGTTARRALWLWAGGSQAELDAPSDAGSRWQSLWRKACSAAANPTAIGLLRQALFDRPGDPQLLAFIAARAELECSDLDSTADLMMSLLEQLDDEFAQGELWGVMQAFGQIDTDAAFAALAPRLQHRLSPDKRSRLEEQLVKLGQFDPVDPVSLLCGTMRTLMQLREVATGKSQSLENTLWQQSEAEAPQNASDDDETVLQTSYRMPSLDSGAFLDQSVRETDDRRLAAIMPAFINRVRSSDLMSTRTDIARKLVALERLLALVADVEKALALPAVERLAAACLQALQGTVAASDV